VGLYTFVDPRHEGGKLNDCTKEDLVKLVNIDGEERLLYKPIPIDVCLVRGSYADEYGNCTVHREIGPLDVTAQCQATKNSGGKVIVQVEKVVPGRHAGSPPGEDPRHLCGCHRRGLSRGQQPVPGHAL
jgi:propionate CoA-transferase